MTRRKPTWLRSIAVIVGVLAVVVVGTVIGFVVRHRDSVSVSASAADAEFAQIRSRFADQHPLVDMSTRQSAVPALATAPAQRLRTFHTVVFDTRGSGRLVRISVPYWFARQYAHQRSFRWLGELTFLDDTEFDPEAISLSLDQLERRGPGLVVDYRRPSGGQFVSWVE